MVLALAGLLLTQNLRNRIESLITEAAEDRAQVLADSLHGTSPQTPLPGGDLDLFAQVVDLDGAVIAADRLLADLEAFAIPLEAGRSRSRREPRSRRATGPRIRRTVRSRCTCNQPCKRPGFGVGRGVTGGRRRSGGRHTSPDAGRWPDPARAGREHCLDRHRSRPSSCGETSSHPPRRFPTGASTSDFRFLEANDEIQGLALTLNHMLARLGGFRLQATAIRCRRLP